MSVGFSTSQNRPVTLLRFPFLHLFGERTLRAIGVVLQAKVFVNLQQTLLVCDAFEKKRPARVVSEKTGGAGFEAAIGKFVRGNLLNAVQISFPCERRKGNTTFARMSAMRESPTSAISVSAPSPM